MTFSKVRIPPFLCDIWITSLWINIHIWINILYFCWILLGKGFVFGEILFFFISDQPIKWSRQTFFLWVLVNLHVKFTLLPGFMRGGNVKRKFYVMYLLEWCVFAFECCFVRVLGVPQVYTKEDDSVEAVSILFVKFVFSRRTLGRHYCACCKNTQSCAGSDNDWNVIKVDSESANRWWCH